MLRRRLWAIVIPLLAGSGCDRPPSAPPPETSSPAQSDDPEPNGGVDSKVADGMRQVATVANRLSYFVGDEGRCPKDWGEMVGPDLLDERPVDPWGTPLSYRCADHFRSVESAGPDQTAGTEDDIFMADGAVSQGRPPPIPRVAGPPVLEQPIVVEGITSASSVAFHEKEDAYVAAGTDDTGQGFLSKIEVDGRVSEVKWFQNDHRLPHGSLRGPTGVHVHDRTVFVADVNRLVGVSVPGMRYGGMNPGALSGIHDVTGGRPGVFVSVDDPRGKAGMLLYYGARAVHDDGKPPRTDMHGRQLRGIRGLAVHESELYFVTERSPDIFRVGLGADYDRKPHGAAEPMPRSGAQATGLDGLASVGDGRLLVTSHGDEAVYVVSADGVWTVAASGIDTPADVAVDTKRNRFVVASTRPSRVEIHAIPATTAR